MKAHRADTICNTVSTQTTKAHSVVPLKVC